MLGTRESTAAPPLVTTLTIFYSDLVFLIPEDTSFLGAGAAGLLGGVLAVDEAVGLPFGLDYSFLA